jgi:transketolase
VPGVEAATGSLGHGLSIGVGMALAAKIERRPSRVFVIVGDGEIQEGSVWEAAMAAAHHDLGNLTVIVDCNSIQSAGRTSEICNLEPLWAKWDAFGFCADRIPGHDLDRLRRSLSLQVDGVPTAVICNTVKGKGIPFAENDPLWHHRPHFDDATVAALREAVA